MAKDFIKYSGKREAMEVEEWKKKQQELRDYRVLIIPESNDYDLYFMEVYIAGRLKTKWNSFRTN